MLWQTPPFTLFISYYFRTHGVCDSTYQTWALQLSRQNSFIHFSLSFSDFSTQVPTCLLLHIPFWVLPLCPLSEGTIGRPLWRQAFVTCSKTFRQLVQPCLHLFFKEDLVWKWVFWGDTLSIFSSSMYLIFFSTYLFFLILWMTMCSILHLHLFLLWMIPPSQSKCLLLGLV